MDSEERKEKRRILCATWRKKHGAEWKARNKEKIAAYQKEYAKNNIDKIRKIKKRWAEKNRKKLNLKAAAAYRKDGRKLESSREYRKRNPEKKKLPER